MSGDGKHAARGQMPAMWVIALTVCAGASVMVIGPVKGRLTDARAALDSARAIAAEGGQLIARGPILEMERSRVDAELAAIERASASVSDPSACMARINTLAGASGVVVDRVSPRVLDATRGSSGALAPDEAMQVTIQVRGNFEGLAAFIDGLERDRLFGAVQGFRVTPMLSHGMNDLSATIDYMVASFTAPTDAELAALALSGQGEVRP